MQSSRNSFKSGSCEMLILFILRNKGDCYAYQISQILRTLSNNVITFPEGSLYPAFYRLIDNGYISDYKKKAGKRQIRVYYHIEQLGLDHLDNLLQEYYSTIDCINYILSCDFKEDNSHDKK